MKEEYEILNNPIFDFPIIYKEGTCEDAINKRLTEYHDFLVKNRIDGVSLHDGVNTFIHKISQMYEEYYLGHQNKAYELFKEAFLYETGRKLPVRTLLPKESLYRARVNTGDIDYEKDEMFHIKYSLRGKVQTQRFSFPGLPCLYLGTSSYVCWLELNRPPMNHFQVAEIQQRDIKKDYEVIDLCIHPKAFYNELKKREAGDETEHKDLSLSDYLRWWPIMAVCSIAVKNEEDPFKPEYIVPQFVLQYFLEDQIDTSIGIKYMSIKAGRVSLKQYESDYRTYTNYVIPVKSASATKEGYCSVLMDQFEVKNTVSGKELQLISGMIEESGLQWIEIGEEIEESTHPLDEAFIYTKSGVQLSYARTEFRKIEKVLSGEITDQLAKNDKTYMQPVSADEIEAKFKENGLI